MTINFKDYIKAKAELAALKHNLRYETVKTTMAEGGEEGFRLALQERGDIKVEADFNKEDKIGLWFTSYDFEGNLFSRYIFVEERACFEGAWKEMADSIALFFHIINFK